MKKKSILEEIRPVQERLRNGEEFTSHLLLGIDCDERGLPEISIMMSQGSPFEVLGMVDVLIKKLEKTKKGIIKKIVDTKSPKIGKDVEHLISLLPPETKGIIQDFKDRMQKAAENKDLDELAKIRDEFEQYAKNSPNPFDPQQKKSDDSDEFNIDDFKGGM